MANVIMGVDCGLNGALATISVETGKMIACIDMPIFEKKGGKKLQREINHQELANFINVMNPTLAVVEAVSAMPGNGSVSMFKLGAAYGAVLGVLAGLQVPFTTVRPNEWKSALKLSGDKAQSRQMASRLWPEMSNYFSRVKDDGRAEAGLLALWLQRQKAKS